MRAPSTSSSVTVGLGASGSDYNTDAFASHDAAIQAAIDFAEANGIDTVLLGAGTFEITSTAIELKSNVTLKGAGEGLTTLAGNLVAGDAIVSDPNERLVNAGMSDFTIDVQFTERSSGFKVMNFDNFNCANITVENIGADGWGGFFGVADAETDDTRNIGLTLDGITVREHHDSTLESVLIFNTNDIEGSIHIENRTDGPGVGLWQKVDGAKLQITGSDITENGASLFYYSFSTENLDINVHGDNTRALVVGGNESDWGLFGYTKIENVRLEVSGTGTGQAGAGVQLGGLDGAHVVLGDLSNFEVPVLIHGGNAPVYKYMSRNFVLEGQGTITGNNPNDDHHSGHPAILIAGSGDLNAVFMGLDIHDDGPQHYPIAIDNSDINNWLVLNSRLGAGSEGQSVNVNPGSTLGDNVAFVNIAETTLVDLSLSGFYGAHAGANRPTLDLATLTGNTADAADGLTTVWSNAEGEGVLRMISDVAGVKTWLQMLEYLDADQQVFRRVTMADDGTTMDNVDDLADTFVWTTLNETYDTAGDIHTRMTQYDDGRFRQEDIAAGTGEFSDVQDAWFWSHATDTYVDGRHTERTLTHDDDTTEHIYMAQAFDPL